MLIEDRRNSVLEWLYVAYGRRMMRRTFAKVHVGGLWPVTAGPSIAYINHSAWWDAVIPFVLSHDSFRRESYAIMEGIQLERYPFFRRLGCFGVTSNELADARRLFDRAVAVLRAGQHRTLWLAPQGALLGARVPLHFKSGLARISMAVPQVPVIPVALRFEFRNKRRPECFVRIGVPVPRVPSDTVRERTGRFERALQSELAHLDTELLQRPL